MWDLQKDPSVLEGKNIHSAQIGKEERTFEEVDQTSNSVDTANKVTLKMLP